MTRTLASAVVLATGTAVALVPVAGADPLEARFAISQGLKSVHSSGGDEDDDDEGLHATTGLDFGLTSLTSSQRFELTLGTELDYAPDATDRFSTESRDARLLYQIQSRNELLGFDLSYRSLDVEDSVFLDELTGEDVVSDSGRREIRRLKSSLLLGREAPLSFALNQSHSESRYTDTTDPDLQDSTSRAVDARLGFEVSPVLTLESTASWNDYREEDPAVPGEEADRRTTRKAGIGATYVLSPVTRLSGEISYSIVETEEEDEDHSGLGFSLNLSHARPNGSFDLSLSRTESVNGTRSEARLGRSLEFPWGGASLTVGASKTGDLQVQPLVDARVDYTLDKLSSFNLSLSQVPLTGRDDAETIRTQLSVGYSRELTPRSRMTSSLRLADRKAIDSEADDQRVLRADLTYAYQLGDDWSLLSGYEYSRIERDLREDSRDSTLFLTLEKTFAYRP